MRQGNIEKARKEGGVAVQRHRESEGRGEEGRGRNRPPLRGTRSLRTNKKVGPSHVVGAAQAYLARKVCAGERDESLEGGESRVDPRRQFQCGDTTKNEVENPQGHLGRKVERWQ